MKIRMRMMMSAVRLASLPFWSHTKMRIVEQMKVEAKQAKPVYFRLNLLTKYDAEKLAKI